MEENPTSQSNPAKKNKIILNHNKLLNSVINIIKIPVIIFVLLHLIGLVVALLLPAGEESFLGVSNSLLIFAFLIRTFFFIYLFWIVVQAIYTVILWAPVVINKTSNTEALRKTKRVAILLITFIGLFLLNSFAGIYLQDIVAQGFSFPPNKCSFVAGYELSGDVFYSKNDACLYELAQEKRDVKICQSIGDYYWHEGCVTKVAILLDDFPLCRLVRRNSDFGRPELGRRNCEKEVAVATNNPELCKKIDYGVERGSCLGQLAEIETETFPYKQEALGLAESDLSLAIRKCQEYTLPASREPCYREVSDKFSGITQENIFRNPPTQLIDICLNDPNEYEWTACLYGHVFHSLTGGGEYTPVFAEVLKSDTEKVNAFCEAFSHAPGDPISWSFTYGPVSDLKKELCEFQEAQ